MWLRMLSPSVLNSFSAMPPCAYLERPKSLKPSAREDENKFSLGFFNDAITCRTIFQGFTGLVMKLTAAAERCCEFLARAHY